jgi:PAS domain S-box-containing protein
MNWQRTNIHLAGLLVVGLIVVVIALTALGNLRDYASATNEATDSRRALAATASLLSDLKDAETGEQEYLLTRNSLYLEPYTAALPRIRADVAQLPDATAATAADPATVSQLSSRVASMLDILATAVSTGQGGNFTGAMAADRANAGKATMDTIRGLTSRLTQAEQSRLDVRRAAMSGRRDAMRTLIVVGSAATLLFLIAFGMVLSRLIQARDVLVHDAERSRELAQRERDRLKTTLHSIGDAVIVTDASARVTLMNPVAEQLTGWDRTQSEGAEIGGIFQIFNADTGETVADPVARVLRDGVVVGLANHTVLRNRAGNSFPIDDSGAPIRDSSGAIKGAVLVFRDVTERYRAQKDLEDAEQRYRLMFENNPQPMWVYDVETLGFLAVNHATVAQYGYSREELARLTLRDIRPPEDVAAMIADVQESNGLHRDGPWRHRRKDGVIFFVEIVVHPLEFMGRNARMVIAGDVTARVGAENAVRDASERLATIVNTAPIAIWTLDPEGRVTSWNRTAVEILGWAADDVIGKQPPVIPEIDTYKFGREPAQLQGSQISSEIETTCSRQDGRLLPVTLWLAPLSDHESRNLGTLVMVADISKRKHDEEALAQTEAGFRLLFENNPQPMWVFDEQNYRFLEVNHAAVSHYGFSRDEFLQMHASEVRAPHDTTPFRPVVNPGVPQHVGLRKHRRKDGTIIEVEIVAHRLEFNGVPAILSVLTDVTERRALEAQLRQSQKLEAIGRLAGGVAHDFNNLLTVIIGYTDMLRADVEPGSRTRNAINEVGLAAERASSLTRQLLAFSRRQVLKPEALDLNQSVRKIQPMISRLIGENIQIFTDLRDGLWSVSADPGQVDQIILNLAVNARDAMERGGKLTIQTSNAVLTDEYSASHLGVTPGDYVRLVVTDTGHGMDAETRAHIFEPFFTTKEAGRGTGLGLAMVYGIVKQSGGDIWVYSEVGLGTSINIFLPRLISEAAKADKTVSRPAQQGTEAILLVEDEESLRTLITQLLEVAGYRVRAVANIDDAAKVCEDSGVELDLLLTDLVLSKGTGWEIASQALQTRPRLKTLFMSGYSEGTVFGGRSLDASVNFIQKPFSGSALRAKIRDILDAAT